MVSKVVNSENPLEHWSDITNVQDKVVLDLGCGWLFQDFQSTPEYFLSRGATKVVGVDVSCTEIEKLKEIYPTHEFVCKGIMTKEDMIELLETHRPQVIKMDIEGYESVLNNMTADHFASVEEIAIEYHNPECKEILERKLPEFGFDIFAINQFGWFVTDTNIMGIMHAKK